MVTSLGHILLWMPAGEAAEAASAVEAAVNLGNESDLGGCGRRRLTSRDSVLTWTQTQNDNYDPKKDIGKVARVSFKTH